MDAASVQMKRIEEQLNALADPKLATPSPSVDAVRDIRRQFDTLRSHTDDAAKSLSAEASHFNEYQRAVEQLIPWLEGVEEYVAQSPRRTESLDEAERDVEHHKVTFR